MGLDPAIHSVSFPALDNAVVSYPMKIDHFPETNSMEKSVRSESQLVANGCLLRGFQGLRSDVVRKYMNQCKDQETR